jgi:predicted transcriptional regulator
LKDPFAQVGSEYAVPFLFPVESARMSSLRISSAAARRIARLAQRQQRPRQHMLDSALTAGLDYEEWFQSEVAKGLTDLHAGRILSHAKVLKELARRKAAFARALKKA